MCCRWPGRPQCGAIWTDPGYAIAWAGLGELQLDGYTLGYSEELGEFCEVLGAEIVATDDAAGAALARTGSDSSIPLARIAIILVAVGGVLILGTRARRHTTSEV